MTTDVEQTLEELRALPKTRLEHASRNLETFVLGAPTGAQEALRLAGRLLNALARQAPVEQPQPTSDRREQLAAALEEGENSPVAEGYSLDRVLTKLNAEPDEGLDVDESDESADEELDEEPARP